MTEPQDVTELAERHLDRRNPPPGHAAYREPELSASEWRAAYFVLARIALEQLDECRAALVRTPETLDVERGTCWFCKGTFVVDALIAGYDTFEEQRLACLACNERMSGNWHLAATPSPTPPEGPERLLLAVKAAIENIQHNRIGAAIAGLRVARDLTLAASPAPDPGALREALAEIKQATAHLSDAEFDAEVHRIVDEVRAERRVTYHDSANVTETEYALAPSAEPPETETTP